jgi:hypothetical protein
MARAASAVRPEQSGYNLGNNSDEADPAQLGRVGVRPGDPDAH